MADRLTGGRLTEIIAERRARNESLEQIVRELYAEFGIEVTRQTLASWVAQMEADEAATA
jgi:transposase-like protein